MKLMDVTLGAMISMSPSVSLKGKNEVSLKTIILRSQMALRTLPLPEKYCLLRTFWRYYQSASFR